jgi:branched-subunit amino acid ABC-type transport system permease component
MISYLIFAGTIAGFYALLALGLVTAWGQGGMVNLGLVGFVGLGAYTSALLSGAGVPIWLDWIAAAALSGAVGVALCVVVRNLRGDYLAIVTLGFAEILRLAETNETLRRVAMAFPGSSLRSRAISAAPFRTFISFSPGHWSAPPLSFSTGFCGVRSAGRYVPCATTSKLRLWPANPCFA